MSETSDTEKPYRPKGLRRLGEVTAALNQPAPCGVLTEEERDALLVAARILNIHTYEVAANAIHNLLARHAQQGETVTVRREVLRRMAENTQNRLNKMSPDCKCEFCKADRTAIAEAEAALAAKGGA